MGAYKLQQQKTMEPKGSIESYQRTTPISKGTLSFVEMWTHPE